MEYYDYKEIANAGNSTSTSTDQVIVIAVTSSLGGIFLFILICCCCSACFSGWIDNFINNSLSNSDEEYGHRVLRRMEEEEEKKKEDPDVRKEKLLNSFERNKVSMVITESSFVNGFKRGESDEALTDVSTNSEMSESGHVDDEDKDKKKDDADILTVKHVLCHDIESGEPEEIYLPTSTSSPTRKKKKISNCCAICLCAYDVGDTVVWSANKDCNHAFHDECVIPWLVKNQNGECPCCRRQFTDLPPPDGSKDINNNRPSVWSIRSWFVRLRYNFLSEGND